MFRPNTIAMLHRKMIRRTAFATAQFAAPVQIRIGIVDLGTLVLQSAVRADASASRGDAQITTLTAVILIPKSVTTTTGDVIEIDGLKVEVNGVMPKHNLLGKLDHYQVSGVIKGDFQ